MSLIENKKPIIAIPVAEIGADASAEPKLWSMRSSYARPILAAGGIPVILPQITELDQLGHLLMQIDGLLLAGGADINPSLYGRERSSKTEKSDEARDTSEILITNWALENKIPILGICRGMQMINVVRGGTLHQDIPSSMPYAIAHQIEPVTYATLATNGHDIDLNKGSKLLDIVGVENTWINSMHHQAIDDLGDGLTPSAYAPDGVIEAIENKKDDQWIIGLQGHPEAMDKNNYWPDRLFFDFITAASNKNK